MTKLEFDNWITENIPKLLPELQKKYPKSKGTIQEDIASFYEYVINKNLDLLVCPKSFLFTFIYNRHYRFFSSKKGQRLGYLDNNLVIKLTSDLPDTEEKVDPRQELYERVDSLVQTLPLDYQNLYRLYYAEGLSTRKIGELYKLSHTSINTQIHKLKAKIRVKL